MEKTKAFGALESPKDWRLGVATAMATIATPLILPKIVDTELGPVQNQVNEPACVSFSMVELLKLYWFNKTGKWIDFSPRFLDILVKRYDGQDRATAGTYPSMVIKLMAKYGCATTATLPNDTSLSVLKYRDDSLLTDNVIDEAAKYKIPGYIQIPVDFSVMRRAVYYYGAISILFKIGDTLWNPSWLPKDTDPLRTPSTIISGHQMTGKGWKNETLNKLRNEWGELWANKGETHFDGKKWLPFIVEAWAIAELPEDLLNYLKTLPSAQEFHYVWNTNMKMGDNSEDVKFVQIALMILGHLEPVPPHELGIYGPKTAKAVLAYQKDNKITPTAKNNIGPKTRACLNKKFAI